MSNTKWVIDPAHSEIHFKVKHLLIATVTGQFNKFECVVETDGDNFLTAKVHFSADINSISTNNEQRDAHLRTNDFFDATHHPKLTFEGTKMEKTGEDEYKLYGTLTMRGVSKEIVLNAEYGGTTIDPWGQTRVGFEVTGKINRKDFGVSFSMVSETGSILLGEEVKVLANTEFVKQPVSEQELVLQEEITEKN
jgi:polyisoprenoid-binding protein YceI